MLKILDEKDRIRVASKDAEEIYPKTRFLLINTEHIGGDVVGVLYAISYSSESLLDLVDLETKLQEEGYKAFIGGDYCPGKIFGRVVVIEEE